jgi:hypothetical protein
MNPYDVHSWSTHYREEVLHGAWTIRREGWLRQECRARSGRDSVRLALANVLSLVRGAQVGVRERFGRKDAG